MADTRSHSGASALTFSFPAYQLRTVMRDGEPWFVASDVIAALGVGNITDALRRLDEDEKGFDSVDTLGGVQKLAIVNESGLYSLILGSRKPEAKKFKKWVTAEVLPAIRRTGRYVTTQAAPAGPALSGPAEDLVRQVATLSRQVASLSRRIITTQTKLVKAQAHTIDLVEGRMNGHEASSVIIDMARRGESRERIREVTGRTYNNIRQAIHKARLRGDLPSATPTTAQPQQSPLDLEGASHA